MVEFRGEFGDSFGMRMCSVLAFATFAVVAILANSCKGGSSDQDSRPLPAPEAPPANTQAAPTSPASDVRGEPRRAAPKPSEPAAPATEPTAANPTEKPAATATADKPAGGATEAASDAGAAPTTTTTAPTPAAPSAECLQKCQGAMQSCISQPSGAGGLPGFGNVEVCRKAFETCQAACK